MIKRKLTFISDPGHGWLSVSQKDLKTLGIVDKISPYSFMNYTRAFLEEDCDAAIFLDAAKEAGWEIELKTSTNKNNYYNQSPVRNLSQYKASFVHNPIEVGSKVFLSNDTMAYTVSQLEGTFIIESPYTRYKLSKSNPYVSIYSN